MSEKPILFSGEMVRAILEGRKTQTRRVIKLRDGNIPEPEEGYDIPKDGEGKPLDYVMDFSKSYPQWQRLDCPYGKIGDRLWVRETFGVVGSSYIYKANFVKAEADCFVEFETGITAPVKWKPSIHMPRLASRISLEIINIRVERLQDITQTDAEEEGVLDICPDGTVDCRFWSFRNSYEQLWNSINAERGFGWDVNPWVWVIEFKKENQ